MLSTITLDTGLGAFHEAVLDCFMKARLEAANPISGKKPTMRNAVAAFRLLTPAELTVALERAKRTEDGRGIVHAINDLLPTYCAKNRLKLTPLVREFGRFVDETSTQPRSFIATLDDSRPGHSHITMPGLAELFPRR